MQRMKATMGLRSVGEVFAIKYKGKGYFFGRVIRNDCAVEDLETPRPWKRSRGLYLVYIYATGSRRTDRIPDLRPSQILIPPTIVGGDGWALGYFLPVRQDLLTPADVRTAHCFKCEDHREDGRRIVRYIDEYGNTPSRRQRPYCQIGDAGVIDALIEDALQRK